MNRILLIIEFDGTNYSGFQSQINARAVQDELERAIDKVTNEKNRISAAGRTDEGVHALAMPVHFDTARDYAPERFLAGVNTYLPNDIRVIDAKMVESDFHARFSAKAKTYLYKLYISEKESPLKRLRYGRACPPVDVSLMRDAAAQLIGEHDFTSYMKKGSKIASPIRTIYSIDIVESADEIDIFVRGNSFLYNMIRIIVGTLINAGSKKFPPSFVKEILSERSREHTRLLASPSGLYLLNVEY